MNNLFKTIFILFFILISLTSSSQGWEDLIKKEELKNGQTLEGYLKTALYLNRCNDFDACIRFYTKAINKYPNRYEFYKYRAKRSYNNDKGRIDDYNMAIKINANDWECYLGRGDAYYSSNYLSKAIDDYNTAIKLNPNNYKTYKSRGDAYYKSQKYLSAIKDYDIFIAKLPNDYWVFYNRGKANIELGNLHEAVKDFDKSLLIYPHPLVYKNRAECRFKLKDYLGAISDYEKAEENGNSRNSYNIALIKKQLKDYTGALKEINNHLANSFGCDAEFYYLKGAIKEELEDYRGAIKDYLKFPGACYGNLSYAPNIPFCIGRCQFYLGNYNTAIKEFNKAIDNNNNNDEIGWIYYFKGLSQINLMKLNEGCESLSRSGENGCMEAYEQIKKHCNN